MKSLVLFFALLTTTLSSHARSTEFGNGGHIIVCPAEEKSPNQFYDIYEAEMRGIIPVFPGFESCKNNDDGSFSEQCKATTLKLAQTLASRLKTIDGGFEAELQSLLRTFWQDTRLINADLLPVDDSGLGFVPHNCSLKQLAIQHRPKFPQDSTYYISNKLFLTLPTQEQAALLLHEILYRWALLQNPNIRYSENVRYFNSLLLADALATMNSFQYNRAKKVLQSN